MGTLASDLRTSLRSLFHRPAFTAVAVLTLALGIGANSAIFSVVHAVLLRPLPYGDAERLIWATNVIPDFNAEMLGGADYLEWRDGSKTLESVAAWSDGTSFTLTGTERPERIAGARVSASFLPTLEVQPARGRNILPQEEKLPGGRVAVISYRFWQRLFGNAPFEQKTLELDSQSYTVIGVLPRGFLFPRNPEVDLLVPLALDETVERGRRQMSIVQVVGRLKPGVSLEQAQGELDAIKKRTEAEAEARAQALPEGPLPGPRPGGGGGQIAIRIGGPGGPGGGRARLPETVLKVTSLRERLVGDVRPALLTMLGAVGFVLLIACANVANLLLARATTRRREIAIRAALGAGRGRIARLLLTESALLGLLGGILGLVLALAALRPLVSLMPAGLAHGLFRQVEIGIDAAVLAFTFAVSIGTGLLFGLAPALSASRPNLQDPLKEGGRGRSSAARGLLVAAEVALAVVLLVGAGLLLRSFLRLMDVDPGFRAERVLTLGIDLGPENYPSPGSQAGFFRELARRVGALPGIEAVTFGDSMPLTDIGMIRRGFRVEGRPPLDPEDQPEVAVTVVGPGYFETLGVRILKGRGFEPTDREGSLPVAVISESMARHFWEDENPVGRRFQGGRDGEITVVGVAADVKHEGPEADRQRAQMYRPFLQDPRPFGFLAVRTRNDPAALTSSIRNEVQALDRNRPVYDVATLEERLATSVADRRFNLLLLGLFALVALALAAVGLYGVLAYSVGERTHEIGIRMALGARKESVQGLILRQGVLLVAAGLAAGLLASLLLGKVLAGSLYGVPSTDPVTFTAIPVALLAVALVSSWLPARRATRVDPTVALRQD